MKTLTYFMITILLGTTGCEQVLDIEADGTISGSIYIDNVRLEEGLTGAYYSLGGIYDETDGGELLGGDFVLMATLLAHSSDNDISWDDVNGPAYSDFIDKDIQITNARVEANWRRAYEVINAVNSILANIDVATGENKNRIRGEALAMRGILYFEMVRLWAPQYTTIIDPASQAAIPVLTEPINDISEIKVPAIQSVEKVYKQAESDLSEAAALLQPFSKNGTRLSVYACWAYLARLHLQKGEFSEAYAFANDVINSGEFSLTSSPLEAFNNSANSSEDIYAIQQTLSNTAGDISTGTGIVNFFSSIKTGGVGAARILNNSLNTTVIENSPFFDLSRDLRASIDITAAPGTAPLSIATAFYNNLSNNNTSILSSSKYIRGDQVLPVVRLAEMYLIRAEALARMNPLTINPEALADVNLIRERAGISPLTAIDLPNAFYDSIILERRRELIYEGHLLHDARRLEYNIGSALAPIAANDARLILPIPQSETDIGTGG